MCSSIKQHILSYFQDSNNAYIEITIATNARTEPLLRQTIENYRVDVIIIFQALVFFQVGFLGNFIKVNINYS